MARGGRGRHRGGRTAEGLQQEGYSARRPAPELPQGARLEAAVTVDGHAASYVRKYVKCSKPGCSICRRGGRHGPYLYLTWRGKDGKVHTKYAGKEGGGGQVARPRRTAAAAEKQAPPARDRELSAVVQLWTWAFPGGLTVQQVAERLHITRAGASERLEAEVKAGGLVYDPRTCRYLGIEDAAALAPRLEPATAAGPAAAAAAPYPTLPLGAAEAFDRLQGRINAAGGRFVQTVKSLADEWGMRPERLYYDIRRWEDRGLIETQSMGPHGMIFRLRMQPKEPTIRKRT